MDNFVLCFSSFLPVVVVFSILKIIWGIVIDAFTGGF